MGCWDGSGGLPVGGDAMAVSASKGTTCVLRDHSSNQRVQCFGQNVLPPKRVTRLPTSVRDDDVVIDVQRTIVLNQSQTDPRRCDINAVDRLLELKGDTARNASITDLEALYQDPMQLLQVLPHCQSLVHAADSYVRNSVNRSLVPANTPMRVVSVPPVPSTSRASGSPRHQ